MDTDAHPHPRPIGRRRFLAGVGASAAGVLAAGLPSARAGAAPAGAGQFVPLPEAVRVLDTREAAAYDFETVAPNQRRVELAGRHGIDAGATAIVATLTAVNGAEPNWVTIVPTGASITDLAAQNRLVSVLNLLWLGQASANLVQVRLGGGAVDIASRVGCDVVLDVIGFYRPVSGPVREGRYVGLPAAARAIDTRDRAAMVGSGTSLEVDLTAFVPGEASAVVVNLTATECSAPGFFTAYPATATSVPDASSLNVNAQGETRAAAVIVPVDTVGGRRAIKVFAHTAAHVLVDVTGYFTGPASASSEVGLFVPADPIRILDTRDPGQIGKLWPGWVVEGAVPSAASAAGSVVVNLTGVDARGPGFLTVAPARRALPSTSNVNFTAPGAVVPNHAITPITAGTGYQVFASHGAHVLVDYMGYYTGTPLAPTTSTPPVNPPPPPIAPEWILEVPAIGLRSRVLEGNGNAIVDRGHSWHWEGTGFIGQEGAHVGAFAHRTTSGGPYRYLHFLSNGDQFTLTTMDGRIYTYEVVRRDLTDGRVANILDATRRHPGTTFSMIACSRTDFTPTSTRWRIVVTGALIGWRQV